MTAELTYDADAVSISTQVCMKTLRSAAMPEMGVIEARSRPFDAAHIRETESRSSSDCEAQ